MGIQTTFLPVSGLDCDSSGPAVSQSLMGTRGVRRVQVSAPDGSVLVVWEDRETDLLALVEAIERAGCAVGHETEVLQVQGMNCAGCVLHVTSALEDVPGVVRAELDLRTGRAEVEMLASQVEYDQLRAAVEQAGYRVNQPQLHASF